MHYLVHREVVPNVAQPFGERSTAVPVSGLILNFVEKCKPLLAS